MAWEPMPAEEARSILDAMPQTGTMNAQQWVRFVEAWMVDAGTPPERIKTALEAILGYELED